MLPKEIALVAKSDMINIVIIRLLLDFLEKKGVCTQEEAMLSLDHSVAQIDPSIDPIGLELLRMKLRTLRDWPGSDHLNRGE